MENEWIDQEGFYHSELEQHGYYIEEDAIPADQVRAYQDYLDSCDWIETQMFIDSL